MVKLLLMPNSYLKKTQSNYPMVSAFVHRTFNSFFSLTPNKEKMEGASHNPFLIFLPPRS